MTDFAEFPAHNLEATVSDGSPTADDQVEEVVREAARSPKLGLMLLSTKIQRAVGEHGQVVEFGEAPVP